MPQQAPVASRAGNLQNAAVPANVPSNIPANAPANGPHNVPSNVPGSGSAHGSPNGQAYGVNTFEHSLTAVLAFLLWLWTLTWPVQLRLWAFVKLVFLAVVHHGSGFCLWLWAYVQVVIDAHPAIKATMVQKWNVFRAWLATSPNLVKLGLLLLGMTFASPLLVNLLVKWMSSGKNHIGSSSRYETDFDRYIRSITTSQGLPWTP